MARQAKGTGRIYRDGRFWRAALEIGRNPQTGRRMVKSVRTKTHQEATKALRELTVRHGTGQLSSTDQTSLEAFLDHWLEHRIKPSRQAQTYRLYEWIVRFHLKPVLGRRALGSLTRKDVQDLLSSKARQQVCSRGAKGQQEGRGTLSTATLRNIRAVLHSALEEARKSGLIALNPAELVEVPRKERKQTTTWLEPVQARKLLKAMEGRELGELFTFILHTGTRIGEATGIRWLDLVLDKDPTATIAGQLQRIKGKGLEWKAGTKTNQIRILALTETLASALRTLKERGLAEGKVDSDGVVFRNAEGSPADPKYAGKRLKEYCQLAGVPEISPHKLRHTAASLMLAATGDLHAVQKTLGHSQIALTANLYGHASAETLRPAMAKLEEMYRTKAETGKEP